MRGNSDRLGSEACPSGVSNFDALFLIGEYTITRDGPAPCDVIVRWCGEPEPLAALCPEAAVYAIIDVYIAATLEERMQAGICVQQSELSPESAVRAII